MRINIALGAVAAMLPLCVAALAAPAPSARPAAFARCAVCHAIAPSGGADIGPNLFGVVGRRAATRPGYAYSAALKKTGLVWTKATLARWLTDPRKVAPGTIMPNPALSSTEREAIVTYLASLK